MVDSQTDNPELSDNRAGAAVSCIQFCEERAKLYPGCQILKEVYLPVDSEWVTEFQGGEPKANFKGTTSGYIDFALVSKDELYAEIVDYKFGQNVVEDAKNNLQGIAYALGLLNQIPSLESIRVWFIMPHLDHVSDYIFTKDQFSDLRLRVATVVRRAVEAASKPNDFSMATPNSSSCLFCGLIGTCTAVAERVLSLGKKYKPLEIPGNITPSLLHDPAEAAKGMRIASVVTTWAEAWRRQATLQTVDNVDYIPEGYILVSTTKRKVSDARKLGEIAKRFIPKTDHEKVDALYDVPIGKLEDLISEAAPRGQKDATVEQFGEEALTESAVQMGEPYAFLRQQGKQDKSKVAKK